MTRVHLERCGLIPGGSFVKNLPKLRVIGPVASFPRCPHPEGLSKLREAVVAYPAALDVFQVAAVVGLDLFGAVLLFEWTEGAGTDADGEFSPEYAFVIFEVGRQPRPLCRRRSGKY